MRKQFIVRGMVFEAEESDISRLEEVILGAIAAGEQAHKEIEAIRSSDPSLARFLFLKNPDTKAAVIMRNLVDARKHNNFDFIGYVKEVKK